MRTIWVLDPIKNEILLEIKTEDLVFKQGMLTALTDLTHISSNSFDKNIFYSLFIIIRLIIFFLLIISLLLMIL